MDPRVLVAGEALVDFLPGAEGPLAEVSMFTRRPGGAPANVAVGLARIGRPPWFWTRVGDDPFGSFLTRELAAAGVPERFVERDPDAPTSLAFVAHEGAERSFTFYRDGTADTRLAPGRVPDGVLESVAWVVAGGVTLAGGRSREATVDLLSRAGDETTVVFDANYRPELWPDADEFRGVVTDTLVDVDVLKTTVEELALLGVDVTDEDPEGAARAAVERPDWPDTVLLTLGERGSLLVASEAVSWGPATVHHAGFEVDAVDTTGAGDALLAGVVAGFLDGERPERTLAFGNAVAALTTTEPGAQTAFPDREEVARLLE
jgi:fructokinase